MGNFVGIIAEYNPFHLGHAYHLQKAKELAGADQAVICLSGPFVQRGEPALLSPAARAEMALQAGADLVIELPCLFACREAEFFARGGVSLLKAMGCTHLAFGAECANLELLKKASSIIDGEPADYLAALKAGLESGLSFAAAQGRALTHCLGQNFNAPNNALALAYLSALKDHAMIPVLIPRRGNYHDPNLPEGDALPSATAVREALAKDDWATVAQMCPQSAMNVLRKEAAAGRLCFPAALDQALGITLLNATEESLRRLPNVSEGLEVRLKRLAASYTNRETLLSQLKTKRYTHARLSRLLCHAMLGLEQALCQAHPLPEYARVLGFRSSAQPLLNQIKKGPLPLLTKAARWDEKDPLFQLDMRAWNLWALAAKQPLGMGWRQSPI
ncbi:MAG: nucleotidyltransferase family protein, partial [Clostridia bacterium]|nr:nucleotidyltransferase family protein [Clostridia bacterium]